MFFFCLTPVPPAFTLSGLQTTTVACGRWFCTTGTDGRLATAVSDGTRTVITESPVTRPVAGPQGNAYCSVTMDSRTAEFEIRKAILSGRPIYYHLSHRGEFYCATHIALLKEAGVPLAVNEARLPEFFAYRLVTPPATLIEGIRQLLPGSSIRGTVAADGCTLAPPSHYEFPPTRASGRGPSTAAVAGDVLEALEADVDMLRGSAERVAVLLSGGIDSSILFRICAGHLGTRDSFAATFTFDPHESERAYSISAADAMGSRHHLHAITVRDYLMSTLCGIAHAEEPLIVEHSAAFVSMFRDGIPADREVVLQGQGADCFFGLKHHALLRLQQQYGPALRVLAAKPVQAVFARLASATGRFPALVDMIARCRGGPVTVEDPRHVIWSLNQYGDADWVCRHFRLSPEALIAHRLAALKPYRDLSDMDLVTVMDFLSDVAALQNVWSKIGERNGRIVQYSFCSERIIRAASQLTWNEKLAKPKAVLRDVARRVGVPRFILDRRKSGFGVARRDWAVRDGLFQPLVEVAAVAFPKADIERHQSTEVASRFTVWNMVNFAVWKRLVIDGEPLSRLTTELDERIAEWEHRTAGRLAAGDGRS